MEEELAELRRKLFQVRFEMNVFRVKRADNPAYDKELQERLEQIKNDIYKLMLKEKKEGKNKW